jgi:AcrR family transcriptional regulator
VAYGTAADATRIEDARDNRRGVTTTRSAGGEFEQLPAGRHGLPREFVIRNQQTRIVDGMARAVARKGYAATVVADVLAEAGVSRRTFYEHYRSKEDCFLRAFDGIVDGIVRRVADVYAEPGPWPVRATRAIATFVDILYREPDLARMCVVEALSAGPEAVGRYERAVRRFEVFFDEAAELSPHRASLPDGLAPAVVAALVGVIYRALVADGADALPRLLPALVYIVLAPYLGAGAAREAAEGAVMSAGLQRPQPGS